MATQDDCITVWEVEEKYPDLAESYDLFQSRPQKEAGTFYSNRVSTTMLGKIKGFKGERITVDANGEETSKKTEIEFDPYRNSTKKDYWIMEVGSKCDPTSGNTWVTNGRLVRGEYFNRGNLFLRELVVFDAEGKEKNRTEITFDKPHDRQYNNFFYGEDGKTILGKTEVYTQLHGFGYKKINPNPEPDQRVIYEWDNNGALSYQLNVVVPQEDMKLFYCHRGTDQSTFLGYSSARKEFYSMPVKGGKAGSISLIDKSTALGTGLYGQEANLIGADFKLLSNKKAGNNSLLVYDVTKTTTASGQSPTTKWLGNLIIIAGADGTIAGTNAVMGGSRPKVRCTIVKTDK